MKSIQIAFLIALSALALPAKAQAFCFILGSGLCAVSCQGENEKITPELVKEASPTESVCSMTLAADIHTLDLLLKAGLDINSKTTISYRNSPAGRNALFRVIIDDRADIFTVLMENHIDVNVQDREGKTPLIEAAWSQNEFMVNELLKAGALPNLKDKFGKTALCFAQDALFGQNEHVVAALKKAGGTCE